RPTDAIRSPRQESRRSGLPKERSERRIGLISYRRPLSAAALVGIATVLQLHRQCTLGPGGQRNAALAPTGRAGGLAGRHRELRPHSRAVIKVGDLEGRTALRAAMRLALPGTGLHMHQGLLDASLAQALGYRSSLFWPQLTPGCPGHHPGASNESRSSRVSG